MRPVIKDFLDALTATPSERLEWRELDRHHFAIMEGYYRETQAVRESFLNDDVFSLLFRHSLFENMFAQRQKLADKGAGEPPTERERADLDRILGDIENMAFFITQDAYSQFAKLQLNEDTLAMGDRIILRDSSTTFSDNIRLLIYKMRPQDTPPPPEPQQTTSTPRPFTEDETLPTPTKKKPGKPKAKDFEEYVYKSAPSEFLPALTKMMDGKFGEAAAKIIIACTGEWIEKPSPTSVCNKFPRVKRTPFDEACKKHYGYPITSGQQFGENAKPFSDHELEGIRNEINRLMGQKAGNI